MEVSTSNHWIGIFDFGTPSRFWSSILQFILIDLLTDAGVGFAVISILEVGGDGEVIRVI